MRYGKKRAEKNDVRRESESVLDDMREYENRAMLFPEDGVQIFDPKPKRREIT